MSELKSNKFCTTCKNLLIINADVDKITLVCPSCLNPEKSKPDDSLIYEEIKGTNLIVYKKIIKRIAQDPSNPKNATPCPRCKNKFSKYARLGKNMRIVNACVNKDCDHIWVD